MASSSAATLTSEERLKAKLAPLADVAIGFVEGLQEVSGKKITKIKERKEDDINLHEWYQKHKDANYYAISTEDNKSPDNNIWGNDVEEQLKLPALFSQQCSKISYCFLPLIRDILEDDEEFVKVTWSREYIKIRHALFHIDENNRQDLDPLPFFAHDFIKLWTKTEGIYVLDFTGEQYGINGWFQNRKDYYEKYVWQDKMVNSSGEAHKTAKVEEEGAKMSDLKAAISKSYMEAQSDPARKLNWKIFNGLSESEKEKEKSSLVTLIRRKTVEILLS